VFSLLGAMIESSTIGAPHRRDGSMGEFLQPGYCPGGTAPTWLAVEESGSVLAKGKAE
jgi:hypothetical protein